MKKHAVSLGMTIFSIATVLLLLAVISLNFPFGYNNINLIAILALIGDFLYLSILCLMIYYAARKERRRKQRGKTANNPKAA